MFVKQEVEHVNELVHISIVWAKTLPSFTALPFCDQVHALRGSSKLRKEKNASLSCVFFVG